MTRLHLYHLIQSAIDDDFPIRRLYIVTGLQEGDFERTHREMLFNFEQELALMEELEKI